jgi:hypothetical protein
MHSLHLPSLIQRPSHRIDRNVGEYHIPILNNKNLFIMKFTLANAESLAINRLYALSLNDIEIIE